MNDRSGVDAGTRPMRRRWAWWLVAGVLLLAGAAILLVSTGDVQRSADVAGATPVRVLSPAGSARGPAVVLAHGFSGSASMMDPMGSALARAGFVVVAPDLPGAGRNTMPLTDGSLEPAVADAVAYAAELTGAPVAVAGHSMGAGAVTSWALTHTPVATVAMSLPSAEDLPEDAARPRNLLAMVGSWESARFSEATERALRTGYPEGQWGATYGDPGAGTARRAVQIAGAEHLLVIYRQQTYAETADWLAAAVREPGTGLEPRGDIRLLGVVLVLVGGVLATRPLLAAAGAGAAARAGGSVDRSDEPRSLATLAALVGAVVIGGLGAKVLEPVTDLVPFAITGYLAGWFAVGALVLGLVSRGRPGPRGSLTGVGWGALAGMIVALAMGLPARLSWASFVLVGPRVWVLGGLLVILGAWFWVEARLLAGAVGARRGLLLVASRLVVVAGLLGAVALLGAPGFLILTVPLVVPILLMLAVMAGWTRDPAAAAAAQAVPLALVLATVFPLVG